MNNILRQLLLAAILILPAFPIHAQKIPSCLENPATQEIQYKYGLAYKHMKSSYYMMGAGLGVTAAGCGLMYRTNRRANESPDSAGLNEGTGMVMVFEGLLAAYGVSLTGTAIGLNLLERVRINRLTEKNDFLNTPGEDIESWNRYRNLRKYDSSKKWMKVSGIATCCLAGYTIAGVIGCMYSDSNFLYCSAETAMWMSFASGAVFLVSWAVNSSAMNKLNIQPALICIPSPDFPVAGISLTANF